jgi:hypothetical protein
MRGIYRCAVEMGSGALIHIISFMKIGTGVQTILKFCPSNFKGCNAGITDRRDL